MSKLVSSDEDIVSTDDEGLPLPGVYEEPATLLYTACVNGDPNARAILMVYTNGNHLTLTCADICT
jgi:hypothetical protein